MTARKIIVSGILMLWVSMVTAQETIRYYLSGIDKDHTVPWDFFCTKGRDSGRWATIPVPSNWELQGFGGYNYGWEKEKSNEQGLYKYTFTAAAAWQGRQVFIVFEGVMTDTEVKVNGQLAGDIHQGGFTRFRYDITPLLQYGKSNTIEVTVSKQSSNKSIERAERGGDFWALGGIYRPVYLNILPATYIDRVAIDAKANGAMSLQVFTAHIKKQQTIEVQVQELNEKAVGEVFRVSASDSSYLQKQFSNIRTWNPEQPNLYQAVIMIKEGARIVHTIKQRFGFRTAELRKHDGFYVNDVKVIFKGVNRHSSWPESGRTLSRNLHLLDLGLMKDMNMNAVRMSHYPPDPEFLDLCDSLGLFVIDELTGWQAAYDTIGGQKLLKELVTRDVNHPSVIMWANGNEGGWNRALDSLYAHYDPQQRLVIHPWEKFNGTDTKHYPDFNYVVNSALYGTEVFFPTEFMHGLYDGGHGAGLGDFWNEMNLHPSFAGAFLWAFHDEGIVRTDKNGMIDTWGNAAPDGIVGPHREKEGSYYTIKEIWSPVVVHTKNIPEDYNGRIEIENRFLYTNLNQCRFEWKLVKFPLAVDTGTKAKVVRSGRAQAPALRPGEKGFLPLTLPTGVLADALYLTAYDPKGKELFTWSWPLLHPADQWNSSFSLPYPGSVSVNNGNDTTLLIKCNGITYYFDKQTGFLQKVNNGKKDISLTGGPVPAVGQVSLAAMQYHEQGQAYIVELMYKGDVKFSVKWTFHPNQPAKLEYSYSVKGDADYMGITFQYPEAQIKGMKWIGRGPYRVWKNRLKGGQLGVWQKNYNNTITGASWDYPEFKGWHSDLYWMTLQSREADFTIYSGTDKIFLGMLPPSKPAAAPNAYTDPPYPASGNIGFMHAIPAIGTKFQPAEVMGPQSRKNIQLNYTPLQGVLWFDFR